MDDKIITNMLYGKQPKTVVAELLRQMKIQQDANVGLRDLHLKDVVRIAYLETTLDLVVGVGDPEVEAWAARTSDEDKIQVVTIMYADYVKKYGRVHAGNTEVRAHEEH